MELEVGTKISAGDEEKLKWILKNPQDEEDLLSAPLLAVAKKTQTLIEVGPRFNFSTADSTNSVSICHSAQLTAVKRIEVSIRYLISFDGEGFSLSEKDEVIIII